MSNDSQVQKCAATSELLKSHLCVCEKVFKRLPLQLGNRGALPACGEVGQNLGGMCRCLLPLLVKRAKHGRRESLPLPPALLPPRCGAGGGGAASALLRPRTGLRGERRRWPEGEVGGLGWRLARHRSAAALSCLGRRERWGRGGPAGEGVCSVAVIPHWGGGDRGLIGGIVSVVW